MYKLQNQLYITIKSLKVESKESLRKRLKHFIEQIKVVCVIQGDQEVNLRGRLSVGSSALNPRTRISVSFSRNLNRPLSP